VTGAGRGLEPEEPPQFAVDLLDAKIPIEMGCQGHAKRRLRRSRPLTGHFNRKRVSSKRSTAICGGRGERRRWETALIVFQLRDHRGEITGLVVERRGAVTTTVKCSVTVIP
jgi:hypothetical protein